MPWNPEKYNQFKNIRYQPFFDLAALVQEEGIQHAVDIGCGTGEQTRILAEKFNHAGFVGIDPSAEMLSSSQEWATERLRFRNSSVEDFIASERNSRWDLIFSNAALQWSDDHAKLFPQLISLLSNKGQFAVQMPVQKENMLNKLLLDLVQENPFLDYLHGWKRDSPLLSVDEYAQLFFDNGLKNIQVIQKVYPIIADHPDKLYDFISGSSLIPYLERIHSRNQEEFISEYKSRIQKAFRKFPAIYAFKRLLLYGNKQPA